MKKKFLINYCWGGFSINKAIADFYEIDPYDYDERFNEDLIAEVERGADISGHHAKLIVVELPEETTDYIIQEYDGYETVIYVVDGKLHTI